MVEAGVGVDVVVYVVGVAFAVSLVGCGDGSGGLNGGYRRPHADVRSVPEGLDGVTYRKQQR